MCIQLDREMNTKKENTMFFYSSNNMVQCNFTLIWSSEKLAFVGRVGLCALEFRIRESWIRSKEMKDQHQNSTAGIDYDNDGIASNDAGNYNDYGLIEMVVIKEINIKMIMMYFMQYIS